MVKGLGIEGQGSTNQHLIRTKKQHGTQNVESSLITDHNRWSLPDSKEIPVK